jgi:hypothetical protein
MAKRKRRTQKSVPKVAARQLLPIPVDSGIGELADWLEASVWAQSDCKGSREEVVSLFTFERDAEDAQKLVGQIWDEVNTRALYLGDRYPFKLSADEEIFTFKEDGPNLSYLLCLLVSFFGLPTLTSYKTTDGSYLFEKLCTHVAGSYLSNDMAKASSLQFGTPRKDWTKQVKKFPQAVIELAARMGDGESRIDAVRNTEKVVGDGGDGGLDVVAWRSFSDGKKGSLMLLGQCATAKKHEEYMKKLKEVETFLEMYFSADFPFVGGFFVPHALTQNDDDHKRNWEKIKRCKNIPFDRVRIALYGSGWSDASATDLVSKWRAKVRKEHALL